MFGDHVPAAPVERALHGPADLFLETAQNSEGRNFGFELVIGGLLAPAGLVPAFDDGPDVSFKFAGLRVAAQCKRPLGRTGLEKNIGKAIAQLETDDADIKLVALSASRLGAATSFSLPTQVVNENDVHVNNPDCLSDGDGIRDDKSDWSRSLRRKLRARPKRRRYESPKTKPGENTTSGSNGSLTPWARIGVIVRRAIVGGTD